MKKNAIALFILYFILTILSCSDDGGTDDFECNCSSDITNLSFTGLEAETFELPPQSDDMPIRILDSIAKADFLLRVSFPFEQRQVGLKNLPTQGSFGFSSAYACSCVFFVNINNKVENIQILQKIDEEVGFIPITSAFRVENFMEFEGDLLTIDEALEATRLLEDNLSFINQYDFRIGDGGMVSESAAFKIVVGFDDGTSLERETSTINFFQS